MSSFDGGDIEQGLHIGIDADPAKASEGFDKLLGAVRNFTEQVGQANDDLRVRTQVEAQAAAESWGAATKNIAALRSQAAQSTKADVDDAVADLQRLKREIETLKNDSASGLISPQERLNNARMLQAQTLAKAGPDDVEGFTRGEKDATARYRAQVEASKAVQQAENELAAATKKAQDEAAMATRKAQAEIAAATAEANDKIIASVNARIQATRDATKLGQQSLEQEGESLHALLGEYEQYAAARERIERQITENEIRQVAERRRSQQESSRGNSGMLMNAGYLLPGQIGGDIANLGYFAAEGPAGLAVGATAIGGIAAIGAAGASVDAASKDQDQLARLSVALKDQGADYKTLTQAASEWAQVQSDTTRFGRDETLPALQALVQAGESYSNAIAIVRVEEDAAAAKRVALTDVSKAFTAALEGNFRSLVPLGLMTREQATTVTSLGDALVIAEGHVRNQATGVDDLTTNEAKLKHAVDGLAIAFGDNLTGPVTDATKSLTEFVKSADGKELGSDVADWIHGIVQALHDLKKAHDDVRGFFGSLEDHIDDINGGDRSNTDNPANVAYNAARQRARDAEDQQNPNYPASPPTAVSTASASVAANNIDMQTRSMIVAAAARYKIPLSLAEALVMQESGGTQFDPLTGGVLTSSAGALGLTQLMPGTAAGLGVNPNDPAQNLDGGFRYLRQMIDRYHGSVPLALTAYNAGPGNVDAMGMGAASLFGADSQYSQKIIAASGGVSQVNPTPSDAALRAVTGVGAPQGTGELKALFDQYQAELRAGIQGARTEYENALRGIADDTTKSLTERSSAYTKYDALIKQDSATEVKAVEDQMKAQIAADELQRKRAGSTQSAYATEIEQLTKLRDARASAGDKDSEKDVQDLNARIEQLTEKSSGAWMKALSDAEKYYRSSGESIDAFITKVRALERDSTPSEMIAAKAAIAKAQLEDLERQIKALDEAQRHLLAGGGSRADMETLLRSQLGVVNGLGNQGLADRANLIDPERDKLQTALGGDYAKDVTDAIKTLDRQYQDLFHTIDDGAGLESQKDAARLAAITNEIDTLKAQKAQALETYPADSQEVADYTNAIDRLGDQAHDVFEKMGEDERKELQSRQEAWGQFADTATTNLAKIAQSGKSFTTDLRDVWKSTMSDMETQFVKSGFSLLFGGAGAGDTNIGDSLQRAIFGSVAPKQDESLKEYHDVGKKAFQRIIDSPTGASDSALTVKFDPSTLSTLDSATGGGGGGFSTNPAVIAAAQSAVSQFGVLGAVYGSDAASLLAAVPGIGGGSVPSFDMSSGYGGLATSLGGSSASGIDWADAGGGSYAASPLEQAFAAYKTKGGVGGILSGLQNGTLLKGGAAGTGADISGAFAGFGYGTTLNSLVGGNQTWGTIGAAAGAGVGTALGGPVGGAIGGSLGGLLGGLFGPHETAAQTPDLSDPSYHQTIDNYNGRGGLVQNNYNTALGGTSGASALEAWANSLKDQTGLNTSTQDAVNEILKLEAGNANADLTTKSLHQGILTLGDNQTISYSDLKNLLTTFQQEGGGTTGVPNTYTIKRTYPDFNQALVSNGLTPADSMGVVGSGTSVATATDPTVRDSGPNVTINAQGAVFADADGATKLANLVQTGLARQKSGQAATPYRGYGPRVRVML